MATAKPKVKRMMFGGAAKGMGSAGKPSATPPAGLNVAGIRKASAGLGDTFPRKSAPPPAFPAKSGSGDAAAALRKLPMNPPRPGTAGPKPMTFQVPASARSSVTDILRRAPTSGMQGAGKAASAANALRPSPMQSAGKAASAADAYRAYNAQKNAQKTADAMRGLGVGAAGAARGMMKKGGAVKKKATKK